jgi:hypothetical protein
VAHSEGTDALKRKITARLERHRLAVAPAARRTPAPAPSRWR